MTPDRLVPENQASPADRPAPEGIAASPGSVTSFRSLREGLGAFRVRGKTVLIPEMNRLGCHLLAATFRSFGIPALVMPTGRGMALGKAYTSGKECYPCQITTGDILHYMEGEKKRLGGGFNPAHYVYMMPEASGPCRFGMYNKYQRLVLDSIPGLDRLPIGSLSAENAYDLDGLLEAEVKTAFRKQGYLAVVVGDFLDRLLLRLRPYERAAGSVDAFIETALAAMGNAFETHTAARRDGRILDRLEELVAEGRALIDPAAAPKPLIGVVGEIYLRTNTFSNQDLFRTLERYGAEVVNASVAEWVNYTAYTRYRDARRHGWLSLQLKDTRALRRNLKEMAAYGAELSWQYLRQRQVFRRAKGRVPLAHDHAIGRLTRRMHASGLYHFDLGTEAALSIPGLLAYADEGYNGVVNVYPFTCMPSTITAAVIRPEMNRRGVPYLDTPCDETVQPGRESAIRTFLFQAEQHLRRHGRRAA